MNSRSIGKLISINHNNIIAEMYDSLGNYINTSDGIRFVGEIGSYVTIYDIGRTIVGEIIGVEEKPNMTEGELKKPITKKYVYINLIGEIVKNKFIFGVSKMPLIFSEICIISKKDLEIMLEIDNDNEIVKKENGFTRAKLLPIAKSVIFDDYAVKINIDKFFGFHFAVFGNTGAGKSNTVASILQKIFEKKNYSAKGAKFIVIDSNGEYSKAFSDINNQNDNIKFKNIIAIDDYENEDRLEIPVWALSADDWAVLLHASEKTQIPIIIRALDIAKRFFDISNKDARIKNHILSSTIIGILQSSDSSPSKSDKIIAILTTFATDEINLDISLNDIGMTLKAAISVNYGSFPDIGKLVKFFNKYLIDEGLPAISSRKIVQYDLNQFYTAVEFATLYEGSVSSQRIQEYTSTLITRLKALKDGVHGCILTKTKYNTVDEYVNSIIGENQIVNIDISALDDTSAEVVVKVLAKLLLDYLKARDRKADMPINFIIEEAHRFLKEQNNYGIIGYNIFERIAKEGRKYGYLLGISSQRPNELSKTVISQCSNFIVHRVQNPDDLQYISKMVPYINQNTINRLTYLQTGDALIFGTAIRLPTLARFLPARPKPDSENAKISEKWYIK